MTLLPIKLVPGSRGALRTSQRTISAILGRSFASTANTNPPSSIKPSPTSPSSPQILDELTLLSQLSPLKRIICLCPVPLGRDRVSWSGGDSLHPEDEATNLDFQPQPRATRYTKCRYGERYAIGVAVSDPYLTHAQPVHLGSDDDGDDALKRRFTAEIMPTFLCDAHNLGSSPIFHTNLPYFQNNFLQHVGHFDIGAIVIALPMRQSRNPFCLKPTKFQLEQERKLDQVRGHLLEVLQNYVSVEDEEEEDSKSGVDDGIATPKCYGPLNVQGRIDHRLSVSDVLSKTNNDCESGNWDHICKLLRQTQNLHTMGRGSGSVNNYFLGNREYGYGAHNVFSSVPPEIHAAVALNTMMEKYTSGFHNSFF